MCLISRLNDVAFPYFFDARGNRRPVTSRFGDRGRTQGRGRKKGLVCVSAGALKARDIALPSRRDVAERVGTDDPLPSIVNIEASVCTAYMGIGKAQKSQLRIQVEWSSASGSLCEKSWKGEAKIKGRDLRDDPTVMLEAIDVSFKRWEAGRASSADCSG